MPGPGSAHTSKSEFSSSEYAKTIHGIVAGAPPAIDLAAEKRLIDCLVKLAAEGAIFSAHDVSDGGLAVTLAESCFASEGLSAEIDLGDTRPSPRKLLFSANAARAPSYQRLARFACPRPAIAAQYDVQIGQIGRVTRGEFRIQYNGAPVIQGKYDSFPLSDLEADSLESAS